MVFGPLRRHILRRLDITATILLIVVPLMAAIRLFYTIQRGGRDDIALAVLVVGALIVLWIGLWWLTNTLERRRPTPGGGLPISPARIAQRWIGIPAVPLADAENIGVGLARFSGRLWGRARARRNRVGRESSAGSSANTPSSASTVRESSQSATVGRRPKSPSDQTSAKRRPRKRPAGPATPIESTAVTLGRIGGNLFGRAQKATRSKSSPARRRSK